jgi:hypothetical protein
MAKRNQFEAVFKTASRKIINQRVKEAAESTFKDVVAGIEQDILNHPISRELISHKSPSSLFSSPRGSLFGFMGFKEGRNPVQELLNFLKSPSGFQLKVSRTGIFLLNRGIKATLTGPSDLDLVQNNIVVDEWNDGRSWPEMLESGMVGLSRFLSERSVGRSKEGILLKQTLQRADTLEPVEYLSPIFKRAVGRFRRLMIKRLKQ